MAFYVARKAREDMDENERRQIALQEAEEQRKGDFRVALSCPRRRP